MSDKANLEILKGAWSDWFEHHRFDELFIGSNCDSPIEAMMLAAMIRVDGCSFFRPAYEYEFTPWDMCDNPHPAKVIKRAVPILYSLRGGTYTAVYQQALVGDYRTDFAITQEDQARTQLVVEVDGHDFHEKTKEQAQRDKSRDRALSMLGFRVLRFTGSEVFADAESCVVEILKHLGHR